MRALIALVLGLALAAPAAAQVRPNRFVTVGGETFGYVQLEGAAPNAPESQPTGGPGGLGVRLGLIITVLTRDGAPVTLADRDAARLAAAEACRITRRPFDHSVRGTPLRRGGISFTGACG